MRVRAFTPIAVLFVLGCSTVDSASGMEAQAHALIGSVGVLHVERSVGERSVGERSVGERSASLSNRTVLRAAFARYRGIEGDSVLRLLGTGVALEHDGCTFAGAGEIGASADADVELLDVGALEVDVADTRARLSPRTFPDLASVMAGVFYAGDAELAVPEPELDEYHFTAEGSLEVGGFDVVVPAPATPAGLVLLGADGTSASLDDGLTEITTSGALTLLWDGGDPRDLVEIELTSSGQTLTCSARDEGAFRIEAHDLSPVAADPDARLTVRRVRLSPFDAEGMDFAFARIAASRTYPLSVR